MKGTLLFTLVVAFAFAAPMLSKGNSKKKKRGCGCGKKVEAVQALY